MATKNMCLLAPSRRNDANAEAFADVLAEILPDYARDLRDYAWDADLPAMCDFESEARLLAEHLEKTVEN